MSEKLNDLLAHLTARHGDKITASIAFGELTLWVALDQACALIADLKDDPACRLNMLVDITAVDHPDHPERFEIVYMFLSMYTNSRLRVKTRVGEEEMVPSINEVHPSANWLEREIFDMFGVIFSGHPDLRRILTDYGFRGHPLRKDFPTTGFTEVRYDEVQKRVVYEPVKLTQEYRQFDFMSPWEGAQYILPGDEKKAG